MLRPCPSCGAPRHAKAGCGRCGWVPSALKPRPSRHARGLGADHDRIRAQVLAEEDACVLCGELVDKSLAGTHPQGPTAHHVHARAHGGANVRANYRLAHKRCNEQAGAA